MWIALAELQADPANALPVPEASSLASLSTHDMAPFAGYWTDTDIQRHAELGRTPRHRVDDDKAAREPFKQALMRFLEGRGLIHGYAAHQLAASCLLWLAATPAELLVLNPEDLWGETLAVNIPGAPAPGTVTPASWLRASPGALERAIDDAEIHDLLREIDRRRRRSRGGASC